MTLHVKWSQIEAECDSYREGFVAVFRNYEGLPTDEKDAQGRTVKVTASSFARHAGIDERTFRRWVSTAAGGRPAPRDRTRESIARMPAEDKAKLAAELLEDDEVAANPVVAEPVRRAADHHVREGLAREFEESVGIHPDDIVVEPGPADLTAEAIRIANRADVSHDVTDLLGRADPDQRPALVQIIEPRVRRVLAALDVGSVTVPDFVPEDL